MLLRSLKTKLQVWALVPSLVASLVLIAGSPAQAGADSEPSLAPENAQSVSTSKLKGGDASTAQAPPQAVNAYVIGGSNAAISSAPWQVALLNVEDRSNQFDAQFCGGSIIHPEWILTAAHCVVTSDDGLGGHETMSVDTLRILSGKSELSEQTLDLSRLHQVSQIVVHPQYRVTDSTPSYPINDIALIQLTKPLTFVANAVQQITVSDAKPSQGSTLNVTGWGAVQYDYYGEPTYTTSLQGVSQRASSDALCASELEEYVASSSLCVSDFESNFTSSACYGDSGGPVTQIWQNRPRLVGVVSFGSPEGCAFGKPWVAANASSFLPWLNATVSSLKVSGPVYSADGYQGLNAKIDLTTLTALNVKLKVVGECDHESYPSGLSDQDGCVTYDAVTDTTTVHEFRDVADFGLTTSSLQGSSFVIPQLSKTYEADFPNELVGVYELRANHAETGELIASTPFIVSDGETHTFTLATDAKKYFPFRDGYLDSVLVTAAALGQFGETVPMLDGSASLQLHSSHSISKTCSLSVSVGPASCRINLDRGKFASSAFVKLSFKDLRGEAINTSGTKSSFSIEKTAVSSVSVSRDNSTVFPTKDGYKDSSKITIRVSSTLGGAPGVTLGQGSKVVIKRGSKVVKSWNLSSSGSRSFTWDGKDGGRIVPGKYTIAVQAIGPEGSKSKTSSITVSAKKLVSVTKTTTYKGSSLLKYYESYDSMACLRNTATGESEIWTLFFDALCFGRLSLPSDAKHEFGSITVSASFKVTDNQRNRCSSLAYTKAGSTLGTSRYICGNGTFTTATKKVPLDTRKVELGVYAAENEDFNVKSITVKFKYKVLR
jgi:secreted trypsin-like serine protease